MKCVFKISPIWPHSHSSTPTLGDHDIYNLVSEKLDNQNMQTSINILRLLERVTYTVIIKQIGLRHIKSVRNNAVLDLQIL